MTATVVSTQRSPQTLLFIDSTVDDYQFLATGVREGVQAIILLPNEDGIAQITQEIQKFSPGSLQAIHVFSHGSPGRLYLGNTVLSLENLRQYCNRLQEWHKSLAENADILLYGCNVAAGKGQNFVQKLSQFIGVNIAASVDLTGSSAQGGNWNLAFTTGEIVTPLAFKPEVMAAYNGVAGGVVGDGTPGSITEAAFNAALAGGGTVTFNSGGVPVTLNLTSEKIIGANTIIDGGGLITLSGGGTTRAFSTQASVSFTVRNLTIANGFTTGNGAAILGGFQNNITVENSQFINNVAAAGGAIFTNSRNTVIVTNSRFENNNGSLGNSERGGGAIALNGLGNLTVTGSQFRNNIGTNGGAINTVTSALTVNNSTFINNDSTAGGTTGNAGYGGAIYTDGASDNNNPDQGLIQIRNSRIEGNKAAGQGGGLFLFAYPPDQVIVEGSLIIDNQVIKNANGDALGGGIRLGNSALIVQNTTFANNFAQSQGGGLWIDAQSTANIINSTFSANNADDINNTTDGLGGAIATYSPTSITNTTFAYNQAGASAGAIFNLNQPVNLTNSIFFNNTASNAGNTDQQSNRELNDGGNNIQFPAKFTTFPNDNNVTATVTIADPLLGPLQDNGGGVLTHALLIGSPAINTGSNVAGVTTDGRGVLRADGLIDVGAFEFVSPPPPPPPPPGVFTPNNDTVTLTSGDDFGDALAGDDLVFLAEGNDTLLGNLGNDTILGGDGIDIINGNQNDDVINGNQGDDILRGGMGNDWIRGGQGNDLMFGDLGNDTLLGDIGNDTIFGGDGISVINGNQGDDVINGNQGDDTLRGGLDNDIVRGGMGNDLIYGDIGNDTLYGDAGNDTLIGGDGSDRFVLEPTFGTDTILDFQDGLDLMVLGSGLTVGALSITQGANGTLISITSSGELLAELTGIPASNISTVDFG